jgi:hypothetical protein
MSYLPPLASMTGMELAECLERAKWLLEREQLPDDLCRTLDTWRVDLETEAEDRATGRVKRL